MACTQVAYWQVPFISYPPLSTLIGVVLPAGQASAEMPIAPVSLGQQ
jgi:hypothetical protein